MGGGSYLSSIVIPFGFKMMQFPLRMFCYVYQKNIGGEWITIEEILIFL